MGRLGKIVPQIGIAVSLVMAPALAFSQTDVNNTATGTSDARVSAPAASGATLPNDAIKQEVSASARKFRANLQRAGYRNIQFVTTAYVVQADTQSGYTVVMEVSPAETMSGSLAATTRCSLRRLWTPSTIASTKMGTIQHT